MASIENPTPTHTPGAADASRPKGKLSYFGGMERAFGVIAGEMAES